VSAALNDSGQFVTDTDYVFAARKYFYSCRILEYSRCKSQVVMGAKGREMLSASSPLKTEILASCRGGPDALNASIPPVYEEPRQIYGGASERTAPPGSNPQNAAVYHARNRFGGTGARLWSRQIIGKGHST